MRVIYYGWPSHFERLADGFDYITEEGVLPKSIVSAGGDIEPQKAKEKWLHDNRKRKLGRPPKNFLSPVCVIGWGKYMRGDSTFLPINNKIRTSYRKDEFARLPETKKTALCVIPKQATKEDIEKTEYDGSVKFIARTDVTAKGGQGAVLVRSRDEAVNLMEHGVLLLHFYPKKRQFRTLFWIDADSNAHCITGIIMKKNGAKPNDQLLHVITPTAEEYTTSYRPETVQRLMEKIYKDGPVYAPTLDGEPFEFIDCSPDRIMQELLSPDLRTGVIATLNYGAVDWAIGEDNRIIVFEVNSAPGLRIPRTKAFFANMIRYWQGRNIGDIRRLHKMREEEFNAASAREDANTGGAESTNLDELYEGPRELREDELYEALREIREGE